MMRSQRRILLSTVVLALTVVGCQALEGEPAVERQPFELTTSAAGAVSDTVYWPEPDGDHPGPVDVYGVGMGSLESGLAEAMITIPDVGTATAVRVQVALKGTHDDAFVDAGLTPAVRFLDRNGVELENVGAFTASTVTGTFFEAELDPADLPGGVIKAVVDGGISFYREGEDFHIPRSFFAIVLREDTDPSTQSKGYIPYDDVFRVGPESGFTKSHEGSLTFAPATLPRPLTLRFGLAELDDDPNRLVDVTITIDDAVYEARLKTSVLGEEPVLGDGWTIEHLGNEALIAGIDTELPAGATTVTIKVTSPEGSAPNVRGDSVWLTGVYASVTEVPDEPGLEGCTPGYWRNHTGLGPGRQANAWELTGYHHDDVFESAFDRIITIMWASRGAPSPVEDPTLLQSVQAQGGGESALARHAVAALLNAAHPHVDAYYTRGEVVKMVQDALDGVGPYGMEETKDMLEWANELGCPL